MANGFALHVPGPGFRRRDAQEHPGADHSNAFYGPTGDAVDANAAGDKRIEGDDIIDDKRDPVGTRGDIAELPSGGDRCSGATHPELALLVLVGNRDDIGLAVRSDRREPGQSLRAEIAQLVVGEHKALPRTRLSSTVPDVERVEGRTARKRRAILEAATELFLDHGYGRTSMDLVASMAAVSKQTVYQQFGSKEDLFRNVVIATVDRASDPVHSEVTQLQASDDLARDLTELAHRQLDLALQPQVIQLRRLVIAESSHFPELGRAFHERGPQRTIHALTTTFARLAEEGRLRTSDAGTSATQFNWLVMADPVNRLMLLGEHGRLASTELNRHVADAVRTFLAAHNHDKDHDERSDQ